ncbi:MAG TPA: helix-turn-helix domain-containing protein [Casimicrobiaceae bacterium]|nr:helix-turn-helix domain-containing protein [Casimicrobiaceae bacterium]
MPNIGAVLKQEIARLSRREIRGEVQATKKASAQYRRHIAGLRRQIAALERQMALLSRRVANGAASQDTEAGPKIRFVAKGLRSQRARLGLSADEYARLVGVSPQSIYNWENGHTTPRPAQVAVIAQLRRLGKREARSRLEEVRPKRAQRRRRRSTS